MTVNVQWTEADLEKINAAIAAGGGVHSFSFENYSVTLRSLDEMLRLRALILKSLSSTSSPTHRLAVTSKGA